MHAALIEVAGGNIPPHLAFSTSTLAPAFINALMASTWPHNDAMCKAVCPIYMREKTQVLGLRTVTQSAAALIPGSVDPTSLLSPMPTLLQMSAGIPRLTASSISTNLLSRASISKDSGSRDILPGATEFECSTRCRCTRRARGAHRDDKKPRRGKDRADV